jgi:hypothetical protein
MAVRRSAREANHAPISVIAPATSMVMSKIAADARRPSGRGTVAASPLIACRQAVLLERRRQPLDLLP